MNRRTLCVFVLCFGMFFSAFQSVSAASLQEILLFKATAETDNGVFHWEYNSPGVYEYHADGKAMHGEKAKKEVEVMYDAAGIHKDSSKDEIAASFEKHGIKDLKRLDVRWQNGNGDLYTWLWKEDQ